MRGCLGRILVGQKQLMLSWKVDEFKPLPSTPSPPCREFDVRSISDAFPRDTETAMPPSRRRAASPESVVVTAVATASGEPAAAAGASGSLCTLLDAEGFTRLSGISSAAATDAAAAAKPFAASRM